MAGPCLKYGGRTAGFTLVEILIALAISGIIATAVLGMFKSQSESYVKDEQRVEAMQNVRAGMEMITREARNAGYLIGRWVDPFAVGTVNFPQLGDFKTNLNDDYGNDVLITYTVDNGFNIVKDNPTQASICSEADNLDLFKSGLHFFMIDQSETEAGAYRLVERTWEKNCQPDCGGSCYRLKFDKKDKFTGKDKPNFEGGKIYQLLVSAYYVDVDPNNDGDDIDSRLMRIVDDENPEVVAYGVNALKIGYSPAEKPCDPHEGHDPDPTYTEPGVPVTDPEGRKIRDIRTICFDIQGITRDPLPTGVGNLDAHFARSLRTDIQVRNLGL